MGTPKTIECADNVDQPKAHVMSKSATLVDAWDHITEQHVWWMRELLPKSDAAIRRELTKWFRVAA